MGLEEPLPSSVRTCITSETVSADVCMVVSETFTDRGIEYLLRQEFLDVQPFRN
jgi:hypothetical protein